MKYFRIKNWEKYQTRDALRRSGPMLFIRLDVGSLWDQKILSLPPMQQLAWYRLLQYAGFTHNRVEQDAIFLRRVLNLKQKPNLALFAELGLIEDFVASNLPAILRPREEERREEKKKEESFFDKKLRLQKQAEILKEREKTTALLAPTIGPSASLVV